MYMLNPGERPCSRHAIMLTMVRKINSKPSSPQLTASFPLLLIPRLTDIQPQPLSIQIHLIAATLQDTRNVLRIVELSQINVTSALLDRVTYELGGASLTLRTHDRGLFFLSGFVDDEGGALGFLLRDLLGFDCGCELGGEGELLVCDVSGIAG